MKILGQKTSGWLSPLLGGVICLALGFTALWIVFSGKGITGGIPLIPEGINSVIGRIFFGLGGLFCLQLCFMAFKELYQTIKNDME